MLQSPLIRDYSIYGQSVVDGDSIKGVGDYDADVVCQMPIVVGGRNLWDEQCVFTTYRLVSKNFISVCEGVRYFFVTPRGVQIAFYDADKSPLSPTSSEWYWSSVNYITAPTGARFMKFRIGTSADPVREYGNNICVNVSDDHDGRYDAYVEPTIYACPIPSPLQGVGGVADSADYEAQGITRRFGVATLNSCFWVSNSHLDYSTTPCLIVQFRQLSMLMAVGNWQSGVCAEYEVGSGIKTANCFRFGANNTFCYLYYVGEDFSDLASANAYLAEHPIHISYPLAAETFEPCVLPNLSAHKRNAVVTTDTEVQPSKIELKKKI